MSFVLKYLGNLIFSIGTDCDVFSKLSLAFYNPDAINQSLDYPKFRFLILSKLSKKVR